MNCPDCSGPMWDNRPKKANGQYKASRADFSCKDKDGCGKGVWMKDGDAAPAAARNGNANGNGNGASAPRPGGPALGIIYAECMEFAAKSVRHYIGDSATAQDIVAATATLFIQAANTGRPIRAPKAAPPPPPPPPPEPQYVDPYENGGRELPF